MVGSTTTPSRVAGHYSRRMPARRPPWLRELIWVLATALVATLVAAVDLELWRASAGVPLFGASGDTGFFLSAVKSVVEHGWFTYNPDLAAPFGQSNLDFATSFGDTAHYALVWLLALFSNDAVVVFNAFFLLGFPLVAVAAFGVLRNLGATRPVALVVAVLFALLPYHLLRNQAHLFLASYYAVPLAVWLVVALVEGRALVERGSRRGTLTTLAACALVGAASNYYAIFALLALVVVIPIAALARRSKRLAIQGALVTAAVCASFALSHAPALVNIVENGPNDRVGQRHPRESEMLGLKLTQMVIPRAEHRLRLMAVRGQLYDGSTPQRAEGFSPSLGVVATAGLAGALVALLITGLASETASLRRRRIAAAGATALTCFLIGTAGGGSALIAYELSPQIRAWNRISIVIAFAALLAVALALTALQERLRTRGRPAWVFALAVAAIGVFGVLDQTSPRDAPDYKTIASVWSSDEAFVRTMEARLPPATNVLQLPYMSYPENGALLGMADYDLLKGYVHSTRLRWSYGATKGRPADWQDDTQQLATGDLATAAMAAGFGAVYLDRFGYADGGAAASASLTKLVGADRTGLSADGRLQFFDLRDAAARLKATTTPAQRGAIRDALLSPLAVDYADGFSYQEADASGAFSWAGVDAQMTVADPLDRPRRGRFIALLFGGGPAPSTVTITLPSGRRETVTTTDKGTPLDIAIDVPPGGGAVRLHTEGAAAPHPPDNVRDLRLRVVNPWLRESPLAPDVLARVHASAAAS